MMSAWAASVVADACVMCRHGERMPSTVVKGDRTPVTVADVGVQAMVSHRLGRAQPLVAEEDASAVRDDPALSEAVRDLVAQHGGASMSHEQLVRELEEGCVKSVDGGAAGRGHFILDPIDGTKAFAGSSGAAQYAVGLASQSVTSALLSTHTRPIRKNPKRTRKEPENLKRFRFKF